MYMIGSVLLLLLMLLMLMLMLLGGMILTLLSIEMVEAPSCSCRCCLPALGLARDDDDYLVAPATLRRCGSGVGTGDRVAVGQGARKMRLLLPRPPSGCRIWWWAVAGGGGLAVLAALVLPASGFE